jgi:hypothetical protein
MSPAGPTLQTTEPVPESTHAAIGSSKHANAAT